MEIKILQRLQSRISQRRNLLSELEYMNMLDKCAGGAAKEDRDIIQSLAKDQRLDKDLFGFILTNEKLKKIRRKHHNSLSLYEPL